MVISPHKKNATVFMVFVFTTLFFSVAFAAQGTGPQGYRLIGSIQSRNFIGAVLSDAKGLQVVYRLGEKLPDGSQIVAIRPGSISLKGADGASYDIYISHEMKSIAAVPFSPFDPFAGKKSTPGKRPPSAYEKRYQKRHGRKNPEEE